MAAILTQNKLNVFSGGIDTAGGSGVGTVLSATPLLAYEITFSAPTGSQPVYIGGSNVSSASGVEVGFLLDSGGEVTWTAFSAESLGFRGARRGEAFIDLGELYVDGTSDGFRLTWTGWGPGSE